MPTQSSLPAPEGGENEFVKVIYNLVTNIPVSSEPPNSDPHLRTKALISAACLKSAAYSGTLALPPGPLGMITILPDLMGIWHIQRQLVADVAACYGKRAVLNRELMFYCLFRHGAAVLMRDIVTRLGERLLVKRVALRFFQQTLQKLGVRITQRLIGRTISRWIPLIGAAGIAGYAYYDTGCVGKTAVDTFSRDIDIAEHPDTGSKPSKPKSRRRKKKPSKSNKV